jgi:hypothetical protein
MRCIFVRYCLTQKTYRFWNPITQMAKRNRDATFDEHNRLAIVPNGTTAPVFQPFNLTQSIQTQEEPVLPSTATTQTSPNKTTNDLVETNVPIESTNQQEEYTIQTNLETILEPPRQL